MLPLPLGEESPMAKERNLDFAHLGFLNRDLLELISTEEFEQNLLLTLLSQYRKKLGYYSTLLRSTDIR